MKNTRKVSLGLAFLISIAGFFVAPNACVACSCVSWSGPAAARERATVVVQGRVVALTEERLRSGFSNQRVTFASERIWKGTTTNEMTLYTGMGSGDCGYPFQIGATYLVYAAIANNSYYTENALLTSTCMGTKPLVDASADLAVLGIGTTIAAPPPSISSAGAKAVEKHNFLPMLSVVTLVLLGGVVIWFGLWRRVRRRDAAA